ncbi:MAG: phospholipase D-like domain-containing protein, partial [Rhodoferax sp.]|nr:phospholipase D-like domain-containing protein [Rhodoferax sp.]
PSTSSRTAQPVRSGARAALVLRDNVRLRRRIERAYLQALADARDDVVLANAYFLPGRKMRRALILAAQRGVRVRLLLQGRYEYFMQYHATRALYQPLLAAGVEIYEYTSSFLHAKVAVVDRRWVTVGSSNIDPLSLLLAREANVMVRDPGFAGQLWERLERAICDHAVAITLSAQLQRSRTQRVLDRVALLLMRVVLLLNGKRY